MQRIIWVAWKPQKVFSDFSWQSTTQITNILSPILLVIFCNYVVIELVTPMSIQNNISQSVSNDISINEYMEMIRKAKLISHILSPFFT
jgi:hypothetical protein